MACYCPQCIAFSMSYGRHLDGYPRHLDGKRRDLPWHPPSPYLEDLTKSLVISQPAKRKVQLVPPRRYHAATSPYEPIREPRAAPRLRAQLQTDLAERHLRQLWDQEAAAAAERCGVDLGTYTTLLELQHRDITPEDYETLQLLDTSNKPKTLSQALLDAKFPAWTVPEAGAPAVAPPNEVVPRAVRSLNFGGELQDAGGVSQCEGVAEDANGPAGDDGEAAVAEEVAEEVAEDGQVEAGLCQSCSGRAEGDEGDGVPSAAEAPQCPHAPGSNQAHALVEWDSERACSICLEKFVGGQHVRSLPCGHVFHVECIDSWLTGSSRACPEDNIPVLSDVEAAALDAADVERHGHVQASLTAEAGGLLDSYTLGAVPATYYDTYEY